MNWAFGKRRALSTELLPASAVPTIGKAAARLEDSGRGLGALSQSRMTIMTAAQVFKPRHVWRRWAHELTTGLLFFFAAVLSGSATCQAATRPNDHRLGGASGVRARAGPVLLSEFINPRAPYRTSHASTIAQTSSGALVAAWFGGSAEGRADVGIWFARKTRGKWNSAVEIANGAQADGKRYPTWNPVLFQQPHGPLFLFYKVGPSADRWWGMVIRSTDGGETWSTPKRLPDGLLGPIKDKPVILADGTWLSGSSTESHDSWRVHFELSRDAGDHWQVIGPVDEGAGFQAIQPTILVLPNGLIEALCRTKQGVVAMTWSADEGRTWTPLAATELPNPNSGIDAITLADGRLLVVYNHSAHLPNWSGHGNRFPLDVAMSVDGIKWKHVLTLEDEPHSQNSAPIQTSPPTEEQQLAAFGGMGFSYPAVIQTSDGLVHITYTWNRRMIKHAVIDPRRLLLPPPTHRVSSNRAHAALAISPSSTEIPQARYCPTSSGRK